MKKTNKPKFLGLDYIMLCLISPGFAVVKSTFEIYKKKERKIPIFFLALALAIYSFAINLNQVNSGGDISRYFLEMESPFLKDFKTFISIEKYRYNLLYYLTLFYMKKLSLVKNILPFFYTFIIYYLTFNSLEMIIKKNKIKNPYYILVLYFITIFFKAPYTIFSGVKTALSLSVINYGLIKFYINKKGNFFMIVGSLIHNSGWIILLLFIISRVIKIKKTFLMILALIILFFKNYIFLKMLNSEWIPYYIKALIKVYIFGEWRNIFVADTFGLYFFLKAFLFIIFIFYIIFKQVDKNTIYFRFIKIYLIFLVINFDLRMIIVRFILGGYIFFIPLIAEWGRNSKKRLKILVIGIIFMFDILILVDYGFKIGLGFPFNLFEPTYSLIFNYLIK